LRLHLLELLLTALLAAAFASVGEIILRRRSRDPAGANESMLVGMAAFAGLLFPLSLILPHHALVAEAALLAACLSWALLRRIGRQRPGDRIARPAVDPAARVILGAVALGAAGFAALNFRYTYLWDGFVIWATKARLLSHFGALTRQWLVPGDVVNLRLLEYPVLVPLYEALLSLLRGAFDFDRLKPIFMVFYLSLLIGTYAAARTQLPARLAAMATLLVCLLPALSTHYAAGGYADMPQAAFVAGVVAAAMARRRDALPWLIGGLTTVKAEGTILAALACAGVLLFWSLESRRNVWMRFRSELGGIAVVAAFFVVRVMYVRWIQAPELTYHNALTTALARIPHVARLCLTNLSDPLQWGLFWPAFAVAAVVLFRRGSNLEKSLTATTAAGLGILGVPFLVTTWPVDLHVFQAYFRLVAQIAPAAAVAIVLAYARLALPFAAAASTPRALSESRG
jgi:hypothetical protein